MLDNYLATEISKDDRMGVSVDMVQSTLELLALIQINFEAG
jgi:hypothetical protein